MIKTAWRAASQFGKNEKFRSTFKMHPRGMALWTGVIASGNMSAGDGLGTAIGKGAAEVALWGVAPVPMLGYTLAKSIPGGVRSVVDGVEKRGKEWDALHNNNVLGRNYIDTQHAFNMRQAGMLALQQSSQLHTGALTQRQAAVQAIQGSKLNARSALGTEARLMHIPW